MSNVWASDGIGRWELLWELKFYKLIWSKVCVKFRKTQKKIQELQTQLEIAIQNEALAFKSLEKLTKQFNKSKTEKEFYEDLAKQTESELKQKEQKIAEQNLTISRLEDQLEEYKEKASTKLAKTMEK